jgi:hypothetical protein
MPKKGYNGKLTHEEIIALFNASVYRVDPNRGIVMDRRGKRLYTFPGGQSRSRQSTKQSARQRSLTEKPDTETFTEALWVRLYSRRKMRSLPVAHCVWLYVAQRPIPDGFEIHHRNTLKTDNRWRNLYCLFDLDHRKLHADYRDESSESTGELNGESGELNGEIGDLLEVTPF